MIKNSLKNFVKNLIYVFVPMGIFYLFLLLTVFGLIETLGGALGQMISDLAELIHASVEDSSAAVNDFLGYAFGQLKWDGNYAETLRQILSGEWLKSTLTGFFETLNASTEGFEAQCGEIVGAFHTKLVAGMSVAAVLCYIGITAANFATRFLLRRNTAKRGVKKFVIAHTLVPIAQTLILVGFFVLFLFIRLYSLLVFAALLVLMAVLSLTAPWLIHRDKNLKLKDVLTGKNVLSHLAVVGIMIAFVLALSAVLFLINSLLAVLLIVPFALYCFCIADVNTDSFVCSLVENAKAQAEA